MLYREKSCVSEMSRKRSKDSMSDIFHESDLILGLMTESLVVDTVTEKLISEINVKEESTRCINNGKAK